MPRPPGAPPPSMRRRTMTLDTPRLILRDMTPADAEPLNEIERDPRVTRYVTYDRQSLDDTRAYLEQKQAEQAESPRRIHDLAIVPRGAERLIGKCGLHVNRPEHFEAVIWYELHPDAWGKGYAVEAASAVLDLAFGPLALHRVWADCDPRNVASCKVARRLGMTLEGTLRENYFLKGEWCSTAVYAILQREWRDRLNRPSG